MRASWAVIALGACITVYAAAEEALSSDFLEFLGDGAQVGGQWIDPMTLQESPEAFASLPPAGQAGEERTAPEPPQDAAPAPDASTPSHADGGHDDD